MLLLSQKWDDGRTSKSGCNRRSRRSGYLDRLKWGFLNWVITKNKCVGRAKKKCSKTSKQNLGILIFVQKNLAIKIKGRIKQEILYQVYKRCMTEAISNNVLQSFLLNNLEWYSCCLRLLRSDSYSLLLFHISSKH